MHQLASRLAAVSLTPSSIDGLAGPDCIFVGGLPYYFTEVQVRELLESFGALRSFYLVKDTETGNSKGYGFCVYQDLSVTDIVCAALDGIKMNDKTFTVVRRANQGQIQPNPGQESIQSHVQQQITMQRMMLQPGEIGTPPTKDELMNDEDYEAFDMASPASAVLASAVTTGQVPEATPAIPGMFPYMFPFASGQFGAHPVMPVQAMTQQDTRHARRVYVGGLSPSANEQSLATFFSHAMSAIGGNTAGPGDAVVNVYINHEKKFAFVDMRSVEEASNALALNGIIFEGAPVKVRRPSDYNPSLAAFLGPSQPSPNLNLAAVGLTPASADGLDGPDCIFFDGFPYFFTEAMRMMLQPGAIGTPPTKVLSLARLITEDELIDDEEYEDILEDMRTECGKFGSLVNVVIPRPNRNGEPVAGVGKVFLEYVDTENSTKARVALNGRKFGGKQVVVRFYPEDKFEQGVYDG